jgi:thiol-disulfide isomerase/thioredoxin
VARPLLTLSVCAFITAGGALALETLSRNPAMAQQGTNPLTNVRADVRPAPVWRNTSWLNTDGNRPLSLGDLKGRVVLLNFWTFTCWNCTGAIPSLVEFDRRFRDQGLTLIGIHTPEFPPYAGEHDRKNVAAALRKHGITYPNAQDNQRATWDLYGIRYWPSYVLIDRKGFIRFEGYGEFHPGDRHHELWAGRIQALLAE